MELTSNSETLRIPNQLRRKTPYFSFDREKYRSLFHGVFICRAKCAGEKFLLFTEIERREEALAEAHSDAKAAIEASGGGCGETGKDVASSRACARTEKDIASEACGDTDTVTMDPSSAAQGGGEIAFVDTQKRPSSAQDSGSGSFVKRLRGSNTRLNLKREVLEAHSNPQETAEDKSQFLKIRLASSMESSAEAGDAPEKISITDIREIDNYISFKPADDIIEKKTPRRPKAVIEESTSELLLGTGTVPVRHDKEEIEQLIKKSLERPLPRKGFFSPSKRSDPEKTKKKSRRKNEQGTSEEFLVMSSFKDYDALKVTESKIHGYGVFTPVPIPQNTLIMKYMGEIIGKCMSDKRERLYKKNKIDSVYMFAVSEDMIIDATKTGNKARYINHSCDPNCETIYSMADRSIVYRSIRDIQPEEELTINYCMSQEIDGEKCSCGSAKCKSRRAARREK